MEEKSNNTYCKKTFTPILDCFKFFIDQSKINYKSFSQIDVDINYIREQNKEIERWKINREIKRLKQNKLIKTRKEGDRIIINLTKNGQIELLKMNILKIHNELPVTQKCYILFDVPEHIRDVRNKFRLVLNNLGFTKEQQSVWYSTKNVVFEIQSLIQLSGLQKWTKVVIGTEIN